MKRFFSERPMVAWFIVAVAATVISAWIINPPKEGFSWLINAHSKTSSIIASYATTTACPSFLGRRPGESLALTDTGTVMPQPFLRVFSSPSSDQGGRENRRSGGLGLTGAAWSPGPGACYGAWRSAPQMG